MAGSSLQEKRPSHSTRGKLVATLTYPPAGGSALDRPFVNFGIGLPTDVAKFVRATGASNATFSIESGALGGRPADRTSFGATLEPDAVIDQGDMFDLYSGGALDIAFLGFAEIDSSGCVNAAKLGNRYAGIGGFVDISQAARRIVFCGTMTTNGLQVACEGGSVRILREGRIRKFVEHVDLVCFNPAFTANAHVPVTIITERCVLAVKKGHLEVTEIAPGINLARDVLPVLPPNVTVSPNLGI
jgi:propionate CoA-transferase